MNKSVILLEAGSAASSENLPYLEACQAIRREVFIGEQGVDEAIDIDGNDERCAHLLLYVDDEAVGTARIRETDRGTKLERIAIRSSHRGQGLGELIVRCALSLIDRAPYIHAQMTSLGFYTHLGFVQEKAEIYYEANIPHTTMIYPHIREGRPMYHYQTIVVAGAGVFGTAVAERLSWNSTNTVILHSIEADVVADINKNRRNSKYFPTQLLSPTLRATGDDAIFAQADYILLVIPSKVIVSFSSSIRELVKPECVVINLAKGMSEEGAFITEQIPFEHTASMKGPTFAIEVLHGLPSAFTFGGSQADYRQFKEHCLPSTGLHLDYTADIRSVELMSLLKNMYAIAIGLVSGRFNSPNVDFLIYTKAVGEMRAFLSLYDCSTETIFRYCGIGDLGLTSLNDLSRNRTLGLLMGKGFSLDNGHSATVIEGSRTVRLMGELVREQGKSEEFPIVSALYALMYEGASLNDYMQAVFS